MNKISENKGMLYLCILLGGALGGIVSLFLTKLTAMGLDRFQIVFMRFCMAAFFLGIYMYVTNRKLFRIHLRDLWMFLGTGICSMMVFNYCYFTCIEKVSVSVAAVLLYTAPIFVMIFSVVLFHEQFTAKKAAVIGITFFGCILVTGCLGSTNLNGVGILFGVVSGLGYALYNVISTVALKKYNALTITFYTFLIAAAGIMPFGQVHELVPYLASPVVWWNVFGAGVISCLLPFLLFTLGLTGIPASRVTVIATVEPIVATLVGVMLFGEIMTVSKGLGIICIIMGIALLNSSHIKISVPSIYVFHRVSNKTIG